MEVEESPKSAGPPMVLAAGAVVDAEVDAVVDVADGGGFLSSAWAVVVTGAAGVGISADSVAAGVSPLTYRSPRYSKTLSTFRFSLTQVL